MFLLRFHFNVNYSSLASRSKCQNYIFWHLKQISFFALNKGKVLQAESSPSLKMKMFCVPPPGGDHQVRSEERTHSWEQLAVLHNRVAEVLPHNSIRLCHEGAVKREKNIRAGLFLLLFITVTITAGHVRPERGRTCQLISVRACEWLPFIQRVVALVRAWLCLCTFPVHIFSYVVCVMMSGVGGVQLRRTPAIHLNNANRGRFVRRWEKHQLKAKLQRLTSFQSVKSDPSPDIYMVRAVWLRRSVSHHWRGKAPVAHIWPKRDWYSPALHIFVLQIFFLRTWTVYLWLFFFFFLLGHELKLLQCKYPLLELVFGVTVWYAWWSSLSVLIYCVFEFSFFCMKIHNKPKKFYSCVQQIALDKLLIVWQHIKCVPLKTPTM